MLNRTTLPALLLIGLLTACGSSPTDRTVSGAGIGAGAGAVGGALLGANPIGGAIIGGAVGAATGAVTDKDWKLRK